VCLPKELAEAVPGALSHEAKQLRKCGNRLPRSLCVNTKKSQRFTAKEQACEK